MKERGREQEKKNMKWSLVMEKRGGGGDGGEANAALNGPSEEPALTLASWAPRVTSRLRRRTSLSLAITTMRHWPETLRRPLAAFSHYLSTPGRKQDAFGNLRKYQFSFTHIKFEKKK